MSRPPAANRNWKNVAQASAFLGVSQLTLRKWSDEGKIPVYRTHGGHRRYRAEDLEQCLEQMREHPHNPKGAWGLKPVNW